jgi:hypothetical protein
VRPGQTFEPTYEAEPVAHQSPNGTRPLSVERPIEGEVIDP